MKSNIILAGIRESGSVVAKCIQQILAEISSVQTELISIALDKREPKESYYSVKKLILMIKSSSW